MSRLLKNGAFAADSFTPVADDAALPDGAVLVSLARFEKERDAILARNTPVGVQLKADQSPEKLGPDVERLSLVALEFPKFRDGRAFSWARMLRTRLGFRGEIRAVGDFLYDQINYQHRVGFDAWVVPDNFTLAQFRRALSEMTNVYQPSADGRKTIRQLRARALIAASRCGRNIKTPTFMSGSGSSGIECAAFEDGAFPPMRKALVPMLACLALCGAATTAMVISSAHAQPGPHKPMMVAAATTPGMQLAANDTSPDGAPPRSLRRASPEDFAAHMKQMCNDGYARQTAQLAYLETSLQLTAAERPLFQRWRDAKLGIARRHADDCAQRTAAARAARRSARRRRQSPASAGRERPSPADRMARRRYA